MKKKVKFGKLKPGDCFRLTENGPIYMKDKNNGGQSVLGRNVGKITDFYFKSNMVYPAKVKISEVK